MVGWGKSDFTNTGAYQAIQKEVDVPLIDQNTCQTQLRATRLGANFVLDFTSFVCAGGETGKGETSLLYNLSILNQMSNLFYTDACTGNSNIANAKRFFSHVYLFYRR